MAMRRVLNEDSSDEGDLDFNKSVSGDFESSSCGRRSSSQDQTVSRKNSANGKALLPDMADNKRDESIGSGSRTRSPLPNLDRGGHGHRPKLSASGVPLARDSSELLRKPSSRLSSATTPKAQMRSSFFGGNSVNSSSACPEGSIESVRRRPAALMSLAIDRDHSPMSSPDTEGGPSKKSIGGYHHQTRTDKTPDGVGHHQHVNSQPSWRRSMSKDRIAAKMHARGASFNELGSLIQAIGADKILSDKKTGNQWKNQEENQSVEIQMRESIVRTIRIQVEENGNVQLGVYLVGILKLYHYLYQPHPDQSHEEEVNKNNSSRIIVGIDKELLEDRLKSWIRVYINFLRRNPSLLVVAAEIKLRFFNTSALGFSIKEIDDPSLRILRLNPSCGNCGKVLTNSSVLPNHHPSSLINSSNNNNNQSLTMMMMMNNHKKKMLMNNVNNNSNPNLVTNYYHHNINGSINNLKCDKCHFNVMRCCFCHESIKLEPLIICLKCGHGIHLNCLKKLNPTMTNSSEKLTNNLYDIPDRNQNKNQNHNQNKYQNLNHPSFTIRSGGDDINNKNKNNNQIQELQVNASNPDLNTINHQRPFLQCPSGCGCIGCFYSL